VGRRGAAVHLALVGPYVHTDLDGDACSWMGLRTIFCFFRGMLIGQSTA
jgi:hypothetical protein